MAFFAKKNIFKKETNKSDKNRNTLFKALLAIVLILIIALMFPETETYNLEYRIGNVWTSKDLIAPFSFPIFKDKSQYEKEIKEVKEKIHPVFIYNDKMLLYIIDSLKVIFEIIKKGVDDQNFDSLPMFNSRLDLEYAKLIKKKDIPQIQKELEDIINKIYTIGVIDVSKDKIQKDKIAIRKGVFEEIIPVENFFDLESALEFAQQSIEKRFYTQKLNTFLYDIIKAFVKPNIYYSEKETEKLILAAIDNVPKTVGYVQQNEKIVSKHERITFDTKLKLESFKKALLEKGYYEGSISKTIGNVLLTSLILFLFGVYLFLFRKRIFNDNKKLILISIIILIQIFFAYLSGKINTDISIQYLIFLPASAMLLAIIYDSRVAFFGSVVMAFLVSAIRGNDYELAVIMLVAGTLAAYTVRNIKQRTQIFRSMIFVFFGLGLSVIAFGLQRAENYQMLLQNLGLVLVNSIFSPIFTYGLLIFFEKTFRVTTDLTLMELTDPNHPLLQILREKTPGTYHHSIILGNLAEAAAFAIGANPILAKVGAYYHDIGKTTKPEYFIENEFQKKSKHQRLTPRMSARIIISHVKEGIELAKEYGLPEEVIAFIPEHHGTTRLSYFYDKALKQAVTRKSKYEVSEIDYRYPGPKPQSKETAIVMLADIVEAYTRSLTEITPDRLESVVDERIKMRFIEGELDECNLTLSDLTKIKKEFVKVLFGTYHQRIKYPVTQELKPEETENGKKVESEPIQEHKTVSTQVDEQKTETGGDENTGS